MTLLILFCKKQISKNNGLISLSFVLLICISKRNKKRMEHIVSKILKKYLSSRHSAETEKNIQQWIIKEKDSAEKEQASYEFWQDLNEKSDSDTYTALERVNSKIGFLRPKYRLYKLLPRIAAVLIPVAILIGGYLYYNSSANDMIEIYAAYGEEKHIFLPDSSELWLNTGTTVKYPREVRNGKRDVYLDGEAYFSVRKDVAKPFIVYTEKISVKVLGTMFNVKAYKSDQKAIATLTSGKVEVSTPDNVDRILKPNEQLSYDKKESIIKITNIPTEETTAWLNGQLIFTDASLSDILQALERKFNIEIKSELSPSTKLYTIKFLKEDSIQSILNVLADLAHFKYIQKDNVVYIKK